MATNLDRVYGTNNAFEWSETVESGDDELTYGEELWIPSNVGQLTAGITRQEGTGGYKIQVSYSTKSEVTAGTGVWMDWELSGIDGDGFMVDDQTQFWCPIPSHIRIVLEAGSGTTVYWGMRAN